MDKIKNSKDKIININWTNKHCKALWIYLGPDKEECEILHFDKM